MPLDRYQRKKIAEDGIDVVSRGKIYDPINKQSYDLKRDIEYLINYTKYYTADHPAIAHWRSPAGPKVAHDTPVHVDFQQKTTLQGASYLHSLPLNSRGSKVVGVLNFASATKPGGGWRSGASAQEESLARSSTLWKSLEDPRAKGFYDANFAEEDVGANGNVEWGRGKGWYTHGMLWSPKVAVFRDDIGGWHRPMEVQVITSPAVNAKEVRSRVQPSSGHQNQQHQAAALEFLIEAVMRERMGGILALFEHKGVSDLVLGSFGTGVFQNDVETVAEIWRDLLYDRKSRFRYSFANVVFAVPDAKALDVFKKGFLGRKNSDGSGFRKRHPGPG